MLTYSECMSVALVIQLHMLMRLIVNCGVPCFSTFSHNRYDFLGQVIEHKMCVWILSATFVWNISDCKKN